MGQACGCDDNVDRKAEARRDTKGLKKTQGAGFDEAFNDQSDDLLPCKLSNDVVRGIRDEIGPFDYSKGTYHDSRKREMREAVQLENECMYRGEWSVGENPRRDGKGAMIWPDGSLYEGFWKEGKAHGRG